MDLNQTSNHSKGMTPSSLRKMECLSCRIVVFPPVFQCKYWHSVCNFCRTKLETCPDPDCSESIESASRSSVAENFLQKHVIRCKYFNDGSGCMEAKLKEESDLLQAHEAICYFREVKCLVPGCYKAVRFSTLQEHFDKFHALVKFPHDHIFLQTSQMILKKEIFNETCGERFFKTAVCYAVLDECIFLAIFRMTSLRMPVFEISSIVHPYYSKPSQEDCRCEISARNEEDPQAQYVWRGPVNQTFPLTPIMSVKEEFGKLKWIVKMRISWDIDLNL